MLTISKPIGRLVEPKYSKNLAFSAVGKRLQCVEEALQRGATPSLPATEHVAFGQIGTTKYYQAVGTVNHILNIYLKHAPNCYYEIALLGGGHCRTSRFEHGKSLLQKANSP